MVDVFMTNTGIFQVEQGVDEVFALFQHNFGASNDVIFNFDQIICEHTTVCIWGIIKGTTWMNVSLGPFEIKVFMKIEFNGDKIIHITWFPDTFAVMRLVGRVSFISNNQEIIDQYLDSLVEMGLFRKADKRLIDISKD